MSGTRVKTNFRIIARVMGMLLLLEGAFMLTALPVTLYYYGIESYAMPVSALITLFAGFILFIFNRKVRRSIGKREGYIIVAFTWVLMTLFGTLPYVISDSIPNFTNAFFETISGFTTTGSSILIDIEALPMDVLYWRSLTQWLGGMGIIVLTVAILPVLGIGGVQLFAAEMPGITHDKLHPRMTATAKRLWGIYVLLTLLEVITLSFGEMSIFESICCSFTTMSSGGFSIKNDSAASCSIYSQYIIIFFMILSGTNFTLHYFALHFNFRKLFYDEEYRGYLGIIALFTIAIAIGLLIAGDFGIEESFRTSIFTVVSILTTTGYATANYLVWPTVLWMLIFVLMFIGGCAGSTSGGIKIVRQMLLIKNSWKEMQRPIHPNAILSVKFNGHSVSLDIIYKVMAFFFIYILIFLFGVIALSIMGLDFETSIGASISSIGNIGPGIGSVGPVDNFAFLPDAAKWLLGFMMLLGRLEIFTVLILFSSHFWRR